MYSFHLVKMPTWGVRSSSVDMYMGGFMIYYCGFASGGSLGIDGLWDS